MFCLTVEEKALPSRNMSELSSSTILGMLKDGFSTGNNI